MTAENTTPDDGENVAEGTDQEATLYDDEHVRGDAIAEVFVEPAPAAAEIKTIDGGVSITLRQAEGRGLTLQWFMGASDAREFVDELAAEIERLESSEE